MVTKAMWLKLEEKDICQVLQQAREQLSEGEVSLDFSSVRRFDAPALKAMTELAGSAHSKSAKVALRGVDISIYKVLKIAKLVPRFTFTN